MHIPMRWGRDVLGRPEETQHANKNPDTSGEDPGEHLEHDPQQEGNVLDGHLDEGQSRQSRAGVREGDAGEGAEGRNG